MLLEAAFIKLFLPRPTARTTVCLAIHILTWNKTNSVHYLCLFNIDNLNIYCILKTSVKEHKKIYMNKINTYLAEHTVNIEKNILLK